MKEHVIPTQKPVGKPLKLGKMLWKTLRAQKLVGEDYEAPCIINLHFHLVCLDSSDSPPQLPSPPDCETTNCQKKQTPMIKQLFRQEHGNVTFQRVHREDTLHLISEGRVFFIEMFIMLILSINDKIIFRLERLAGPLNANRSAPIAHRITSYLRIPFNIKMLPPLYSGCFTFSICSMRSSSVEAFSALCCSLFLASRFCRL